jgi:exopolysaccharide production protein ExoQ
MINRHPAFVARSSAPVQPSLRDWIEHALVPVLDIATALYVLAIAAGAHAIIDIVLYGAESGRITTFGIVSQAAWPVAYLAVSALAMLRHAELRAAASSVPWLLGFPLLAALSVAWSLDPAVTANGALRLAMSTAIGIWLGARFGTLAIARLVLWVLASTVAVSLLLGLAGVDAARLADGAVRGVFYHKNTMGNRSALLFAIAMALLIAGHRRPAALIGLGLALLGLGLARSGTSLVTAAAVAAASLCLVLRGQALVVAFRLALVGGLLVLGASVLLLFHLNPVSEVLSLLGKDATLTGRVFLWETAMEQIRARPLLGTGFGAFWSSAIDWRTHLVLAEMGNILHFHNTYLEVGVQLGGVGLATALAMLAGYARLGIAHLVAMPGRVGLWPLLFLVVPLVTMLAEYDLFTQHNLAHIVLVALAVAMKRELSAGRGRPEPRPMPPPSPLRPAVRRGRDSSRASR